MGALEGKREQQPRSCDCDHKAGNAAGDSEQDAFRESLYDDLPPRGANGQAHCGLSTARHPASQQQVRDIGTCDQQH